MNFLFYSCTQKYLKISYFGGGEGIKTFSKLTRFLLLSHPNAIYYIFFIMAAILWLKQPHKLPIFSSNKSDIRTRCTLCILTHCSNVTVLFLIFLNTNTNTLSRCKNCFRFDSRTLSQNYFP